MRDFQLTTPTGRSALITAAGVHPMLAPDPAEQTRLIGDDASDQAIDYITRISRSNP